MEKMMDDIEMLELRIEDWRDYLDFIESDEVNRERYDNYQDNKELSKMPYLHLLMEYHTERII